MICLAAQRPHQPTPELFHEVRGDGQVVCEETTFTKLDRFVFLSESQTEFLRMWKDIEESCQRIMGVPSHRLDIWSRGPGFSRGFDSLSYQSRVQRAASLKRRWDIKEIGENYIAIRTCNLEEDPSEARAPYLSLAVQGDVWDFVRNHVNAIELSMVQGAGTDQLRMSTDLESALAAASGIVFYYQHFDGIAYPGIAHGPVIWDAFSRLRGDTDAVWHKWASV